MIFIRAEDNSLESTDFMFVEIKNESNVIKNKK